MDTAHVLMDEETMRQRLLLVDDDAHLREWFYPKLLQHAGTEKNAHGLALVLLLAVEDYTDGLPAMMKSLLLMRAREYFEAMTLEAELINEAVGLIGEK